MAASGSSWIEVFSDGTSGGTKVYLVLRAYDGGEYRHEIPFIKDLQWSCATALNNPNAIAELQLRLQPVRVNVRAPIMVDTKKTTVEDLITEIAAGRLAREPDDDEPRYMTMDETKGYLEQRLNDVLSGVHRPKPAGSR